MVKILLMIQSIGKILKEERLKQGISLQEVTNQTLIRKNYLIAIEEDDFSILASKAQLNGFIKIYVDFLQLNPDQLSLEGNGVSNGIFTEEAPPFKSEESENSDISHEPLPSEFDSSQNLSEIYFKSETIEDPLIKSKDDKTKSQSLFKELGSHFQQRRQVLNFSLATVEEYIHIKEAYLEALENGDQSKLPSPVQTQGMIKNYSKFLNLDENEMLLIFAEGLQERRVENSRQNPTKTKSASPVSATTLSIKKFFTLDLLFGSILIIGILVFLIWGVSNLFSFDQSGNFEPTIPNIAEVLISTDISAGNVTQTPESNESELDVPETEPTAILVLTPLVSNAPIQVTIVARYSSWIRVIGDGKTIYQGRIEAGNAFTYSAETQLELVSGNAAALQVFFKDEDQGPLGLLGQVVTLLFDKSGLIRPTSTPSPTPTPTPPISITPTSGAIN